jgi:hypothetical protein
MKLYVDGCSFVYGDHLPREYSLANLLNADIDNSECGKSNIAMFEDVYKNINDYDTFIIGFTFSSRYTFCNRLNERRHLIPSRYVSYFGNYNGSALDEEKFIKLTELFIYFSDIDVLDFRSDVYVDSIIDLLKKHNKKYVLFSWEKRNLRNNDDIFYPTFSEKLKLPDGHLNEQGLQELAKLVRQKYE